VTDDAGRKSTLASQTITVGSGTPTALFTYSPQSPVVNQSVAFDASTATAVTGRTITDYAWSFDDGSSGSGMVTSHAYGVTGSYKVTLTVTDSQGQKQSSSQTIAVGSGAPNIVVTVTADASGAIAHFDAQQTTAAAGFTLTNFTWTFGDNTSLTGTPGTVVGGQPISTPVHQYPKAGTYSALLTVYDSGGHLASRAITVTVQ
jgi:PKD repeat protein